MSFQLIYTSAERGLKSGSRGFTTVAMTEGMPAHCLQLCESMSGYVHVFELNSGNYERNPVGWSHYRIKSGPNEYSVISRVSAHPKDYTGRTNKIAHHLMLEHPQELQSYANGPGDLLGSPFFSQEWSGAPHFLPEGQHPPSTQAKLDPQAGHWQAAGLPTSAAARIAQALEQGTDSPIVLLFEAGADEDRVGLIQDILDLIPPSKRWEIGFSTYYSMHPTGADIHIRACAKGTDAARRAARHPRAVVVDIGTGSIEGLQHLPEADASLNSAATSGTIPEWAREPDPPAPQRKQEETEEPEESPQFKPLPPPRPDRPGAVRKRKPPPPPGKARPRSSAHTSKTPKELIGVLVGLLLLLSAGGLFLMTRDKSEGPEPSAINNETDITEAATPGPEEGGGIYATPPATSSPESEIEEQVVEIQAQKDTSDGDTKGSTELYDEVENDESEEDREIERDVITQKTEQKRPKDIVPFRQLNFPEKIPEKGNDFYFFTHNGKKVPLKISSGMGGELFLVTDDDKSEKIKDNELTEAHIPKAAILLFKNKDESHLVYYRSNSVNINGDYKNGLIVIKNDSEKNLIGFIQDFHKYFSYEVKGTPTGINFSEGNFRLDTDGDKAVKIFQALAKDEKVKGRQKSVEDITLNQEKLDEISNLEKRADEEKDKHLKRKIEELQKFIVSTFKAEGGSADKNNLSNYFSSDTSITDESDPRRVLYRSFNDKNNRIVSEFNSLGKREKYEERMSELLEVTFKETGLDKWIEACSAAMEAAKVDRLKKHDSEKRVPHSFNFDVKVNNDVLIRINVSTE